MAETFLTIQQVSEMLNLAEGTLRWMRHTGKGPDSFKLGRKIAYREVDVEAYIEQQLKAEQERRRAKGWAQ